MCSQSLTRFVPEFRKKISNRILLGLPFGSAVGLARPMSAHLPFWRRLAADKTSIYVPSHREWTSGTKWDKNRRSGSLRLQFLSLLSKIRVYNVRLHGHYDYITRVNG